MHEGRWTECRLARQSAVEKAGTIAARDAVRARELHEEIVRVLAIDQRRAPVSGFPGLQEERIAFLPDRRRLDRDHRLQTQRSGTERALGHCHPHVVAEDLGVAPWAALVVVDPVRKAVQHDHPGTAHDVDALMPGGFGLPRGAGGFATHRVRAIHTRHRHLAHVHPRHVHPAMRRFGCRVRGSRVMVVHLRLDHSGPEER